MTPQIKERKHDKPRVEYRHAIETKPQKHRQSSNDPHKIPRKTNPRLRDPFFEELREELGL
jgi:hypothetical protein